MSKKNNLEFDRTEPAFLRRLRDQISGNGDADPHRHANPVARPTRAKRLDADEDDGPTYVMEDTNATLTKDEYEALVKEDTGSNDHDGRSDGHVDTAAEDNKSDESKVTQKLGLIGGVKKRKAVKVIGGGDDDSDPDSAIDRNGALNPDVEKRPDQEAKPSEKRAPKKKKAKVKIDFGDDEEP